MSATPVVHDTRRVTRPGLRPWGLAAFALALFAPHAALATEVPFGSQSVISTSADDAFSVFAADVDGDGDMDALSASFVDNKIAWYENDGALPPTWTTRAIADFSDSSSAFAALARRLHGAALGRDGADGGGEEVPSGEGLSRHAAVACGSGQESQRRVKREPRSPSTFNGRRDITGGEGP